jgi:excisionase family DNA binding protein
MNRQLCDDLVDTNFLTIDQVMAKLSCSRSYVYSLIRENKLYTVKFGRLHRISEASLLAYLRTGVPSHSQRNRDE